MTGRSLRVTARIVFLLCGLTSLFTEYPYFELRGETLPVQSEWIVFAAGLTLVGGFNLVIVLLRRSWIARICHRERDDEHLFSAPLQLLGILAAISYTIGLFAWFAPHTWSLNPQIMFALCPLYFVKMTIDPAPVWIFFLLAPMNAAVYACLGSLIGYVRLALRR